MRNAIVAMILFLAPSRSWSQAAPPRLTLDWEAMAKRIVQQLAFEPGETFLAVAHPGTFDDLLPHLRYEVMKAGAVDLGVLDVLGTPVPSEWSESVLLEGGTKARGELKEMLAGVDASIMLPGANPGQPAYAAIQDLLREGKGRTIHFHWLDNNSAFPLPGQPLPARSEIESVYQRALLETDYRAIASRQRELERAMRAGEVRITTPAGTDLRFRIGARVVNFQDGDASRRRTDQGVVLIDREIELPAGAIRVAPLEETVQGTIVFPPSQWSGRPVQGLKLGIVDGKVTSVEAAEGKEWAEREMEAAGRSGAVVSRIRSRPQPSARCAGGAAVDPVLRLWRGRGAAVARRQQRARWKRDRGIRALELLHRCDGCGERRDVGLERQARTKVGKRGINAKTQSGQRRKRKAQTESVASCEPLRLCVESITRRCRRT